MPATNRLRRVAQSEIFSRLISPTLLQRKSPLLADIVAKVSNRGATIFPPEGKTGRDRGLIWPQAYYRSRR